MTDLSKTAGNPTHAIKAQYDALMAIQELPELQGRLLAIFKAGGLSDKNRRKAEKAVSELRSLQDGLFYTTNYLLAGSGHAVVR